MVSRNNDKQEGYIANDACAGVPDSTYSPAAATNIKRGYGYHHREGREILVQTSTPVMELACTAEPEAPAPALATATLPPGMFDAAENDRVV